MRCPECGTESLHQRSTRAEVVEVCSSCRGVWLEMGQIGEFVSDPRKTEQYLLNLPDRTATGRQCPHCSRALERGAMPEGGAAVNVCPDCGGLWFEAGELNHAGAPRLDVQPSDADRRVQERAEERKHGLAAGLLALPNLFVRSAVTLALLYGMLGIVLIAVVELGYIGPTVALFIGIAIAALQYILGPWIMDAVLGWTGIYKMHWVHPEELPEHLQQFVERVCSEHRMKFPSFGLIDDGAPTAFTYGHHPSNARVIISRGLIDILAPDELEAVVAHELGHARNWDMALMTVANLVPLLLYYLYRVGINLGGNRRGTPWALAVALGAYLLYVISEYLVLWFSRTREYFADRFAGRVTNNPNALARALVKIAYGLARVPTKPSEKESGKDKKKNSAKAEPVSAGLAGTMGALNIFDRGAAVSMVMGSATGQRSGVEMEAEQIKGAMQWDLWNPWAIYYELHSTHPLVAHRLQYLGDQAAALGQEPVVIFDRAKPQSYWDTFLTDLLVMMLPWLGFALGILAGVGAAVSKVVALEKATMFGLGGALVLAGLGSLLKTRFAYRKDFFPYLSVAALLHKVKVSGIRPVPVTLTGTIIGKGVPGLVWSEDFVLRDQTGLMFLDYRQPLAIWNFLFGLFRANQYQGKQVRAVGWFRRSPVPYLELFRVETIDGSLPVRRCYSYYAKVALGVVLAVAGTAVAIAGAILAQ